MIPLRRFFPKWRLQRFDLRFHREGLRPRKTVCICVANVGQKTIKTSAVHARIEPQIKKKAEEILRSLGLTPTEAIRILYKQISLRGGLPFPIAIPNELTVSTLEKSRRGEDVQEFELLEAMFNSWKK
jgi:DNA-damage-inducible protein J